MPQCAGEGEDRAVLAHSRRLRIYSAVLMAAAAWGLTVAIVNSLDCGVVRISALNSEGGRLYGSTPAPAAKRSTTRDKDAHVRIGGRIIGVGERVVARVADEIDVNPVRLSH